MCRCRCHRRGCRCRIRRSGDRCHAPPLSVSAPAPPLRVSASSCADDDVVAAAAVVRCHIPIGLPGTLSLRPLIDTAAQRRMRSIAGDPMQPHAVVYPTAVAPDLGTVSRDKRHAKNCDVCHSEYGIATSERSWDAEKCHLLTGNDSVDRDAASAARNAPQWEISVGARSGVRVSACRRRRSCERLQSDDPSPSAR